MTQAAPTAASVGASTAAAAGARRRIVINGRFAGRPITGVERYAREIVAALDALLSERHSSVADLDICLAVPKGTQQSNLDLTAIETREVGRLSGYAWEQIELPLFAGRDLVLNLCNIAPLLAPRSIVCVHDAQIWLVPENYSLAFRLANRVLQPLSIWRSRRWITVSQSSSDELVACGAAGRPSEAVIPNAAGHALRWSPDRARLDTSKLPPRYVFALASKAPNKNMALVYRLAERLAAGGIVVVAAGGGNSRVFGQAADAGSSNVVHLGRVSDDDLAVLFRGAQCFLFPSLHEGFGLPAIEAMQLGCAVVASSAPAMPEVLGSAAVLCDPTDIDVWAAAVEHVCRDEGARQRLIESGRARAASYSWRASAEKLATLLSEASGDAIF